jgi:hypothetical protein
MNACIHAAAAESNYPDLVAGTFFPDLVAGTFFPPDLVAGTFFPLFPAVFEKKKVAATKTGRFADPGGLELGLGIGSD